MRLHDEIDNKVVITTRYVLDAGSLITYVTYDDDGDWQFFGDEEVSENDARVISVKQILALDASLYSLPDLELGQSASRLDEDSDWKRVK
ncbi:MAG: hypothetical protein E6767_11365 [Dysgonomonas sp.]|nr:hypothetical protein [Dysgonomonas sp.]